MRSRSKLFDRDFLFTSYLSFTIGCCVKGAVYNGLAFGHTGHVLPERMLNVQGKLKGKTDLPKEQWIRGMICGTIINT